MDVFSIATTALTAFLGSSIATAWVAHHLTIQRVREELLRSKLEELFLAISGFSTQMNAAIIAYHGAMVGKITYDQANDLSNRTDISPRYFEKIQMMINLYFPELLDTFNSLLAARDKVATVRDAFKQAYVQGRGSPEFAKQYSDASQEFDEIVKLLHLLLAGLSRDMIRPPSALTKVMRWFQRLGPRQDTRRDGEV